MSLAKNIQKQKLSTYDGKLKKLLDELEHHNTIRQVGSFSSDNPFIVFIVLPFVVH